MQDLKRSGYRVPSLWPEVRLSQILMQDLKPPAMSTTSRLSNVRLSQILMQDLKLSKKRLR